MLRPDDFLYEVHKEKQTPEWANKVVERLRLDWLRVVTESRYRDAMSMLLSTQSMDRVRKYFDDDEFLNNVPLKPLPLMEKPRNIFIEEIKNTGIKPYIEATDPSAKKDKQDDKNMLMTRRIVEQQVNQLAQKTGLPPTKITGKDFNGNIDDFDEIGLDDRDQSDVKFFLDTYYKLDYETHAQLIIDAITTLNCIADDIPRYVNDILAVKAMCKQSYVCPTTGQIKTQYLQPNETRWIKGNKRDGSDAKAAGWERQITLQQLLEQLGNAFNFEQDWRVLVQAINYGNNTNFDGFIRGSNQYVFNDVGELLNQEGREERRSLNLCDWGNISTFNYKVYFGYIEWQQPYVTIEKRNTKTGQRFTVDSTFEPTLRSAYEKENWYSWTTKTSNYLATGISSQHLYGYGDLYQQLLEGQYDEYSRGTISIIREEGISAVDVAEIYIDLCNYTYYKMLWTIHRSKPDVWSFAYESIRDVAMKMMPESSGVQGTDAPKAAGAFGSAINSLIEQFDKKLVMLHTMPIVDGQVVGGGGVPHQKIAGSLDALAVQLREVILEWGEQQITDKLGLNDLRQAQSPNPKDGLKLGEISLQQSRAATGYIPDMVQYGFEHTAKLILLYAQDIINYNKDSKAYKFLTDLVGKEVLLSVEQLGNVAAHRFGIFVRSFTTAADKAQVDQEAAMAWQKGEITYPQYQLVKAISDPRVAAMKFAYLEEKKRKQEQQAQAQIEQQKQQTLQMSHQMEMEKLVYERGTKVGVATIEARSLITSAQIQSEGRLQVKEVGIAAKPQEQAQKAQHEKELLEIKNDMEQQKSLTAPMK